MLRRHSYPGDHEAGGSMLGSHPLLVLVIFHIHTSIYLTISVWKKEYVASKESDVFFFFRQRLTGAFSQTEIVRDGKFLSEKWIRYGKTWFAQKLTKGDTVYHLIKDVQAGDSFRIGYFTGGVRFHVFILRDGFSAAVEKDVLDNEKRCPRQPMQLL